MIAELHGVVVTETAAHVAHVIDESGVTPVLFRRTRCTAGGTEWSNAEPFSLPPDAVLCFGPGVQPVTDLLVFPHETVTLEWSAGGQ